MIKTTVAELDYTFSWAKWLAAADPDDTISTSTFTVEDGLTKGVTTHDDTTCTVWLSGGTDQESYDVTNTIVTAGGRTDARTRTISVRTTSRTT